MRILAIESSSRNSAVAILDCTAKLSDESPEILATVFSDAGHSKVLSCEFSDPNGLKSDITPKSKPRGTSSTLVPEIDQLLKKHDLTLPQIDLIAIGVGPGSFTGLRIGVVTAKTLAYATGAKVVGIDTFDNVVCQAIGWSHQSGEANSRILGLGGSQADGGDRSKGGDPFNIHIGLDVGRGEVLTAKFMVSGNSFAIDDKAQIQQPDAWLKSIPPGSLVSGSGVELAMKSAPETVNSWNCPPQEYRSPNVEMTARLGLAQFLRNGADDFWKLEPTYSRPSYAEESSSGS